MDDAERAKLAEKVAEQVREIAGNINIRNLYFMGTNLVTVNLDKITYLRMLGMLLQKIEEERKAHTQTTVMYEFFRKR